MSGLNQRMPGSLMRDESTARSRLQGFAIGVPVLCTLAILGWQATHLSGAFLGDDFSHVGWIFSADAHGELAKWVLMLFYAPLPNGNYAYRPLTFLTFALDWTWHGNNAVGWRATNVFLHLCCTLLVGGLVARWLRRASANAVLGGAIAACIFAAFPFAGEIAYWPVGRADLLACLFSLLYLYTLSTEVARAHPVRHAVRLLLFVGALLSKESAVPLLVTASLASFALASGEPPLRVRDRLRFVAREVGPSFVLLIAYLAWRKWLFDSFSAVYPSVPATRDLAEFVARLASFINILRMNVGERYDVWSVLAVLGIAAMVVAFACSSGRKAKQGRALAVALAAAALIYFASPALSLPLSGPSGEGSRNLYLGWSYFAMLGGVLLGWQAWHWVPGVAFAALMFAGQIHSLAEWQRAGVLMQRVLLGVAPFAQGIERQQYALILLPDHRGPALFARAAQGGIVQQPSQPRDYDDRAVVMLSGDFERWSRFLRDGTVTRLKGGAAFDPADFVGLFCWNDDQGGFVPLTAGAAANDAQGWRALAQANFEASGCILPF